MLGEVTHLQAISDDLKALTSDPHKLPPASEQVRWNGLWTHKQNRHFTVLHVLLLCVFSEALLNACQLWQVQLLSMTNVFLPLRWSWTWRAQTLAGHIKRLPHPPAPLCPGSQACAGWFSKANHPNLQPQIMKLSYFVWQQNSFDKEIKRHKMSVFFVRGYTLYASILGIDEIWKSLLFPINDYEASLERAYISVDWGQQGQHS